MDKESEKIQIEDLNILHSNPEAAILLNHDVNPAVSITSMAFPSIMHKVGSKIWIVDFITHCHVVIFSN
jgi:hypothetical protein